MHSMFYFIAGKFEGSFAGSIACQDFEQNFLKQNEIFQATIQGLVHLTGLPAMR